MFPRTRSSAGDPPPSRRYGLWGALLGVVLLVGGALLVTGTERALGVVLFGYGLGVGVAAVFMALGWRPRGRR